MILRPQPTLTPSVYKLSRSARGRLVGTFRVNTAEPTNQEALYAVENHHHGAGSEGRHS